MSDDVIVIKNVISEKNEKMRKNMLKKIIPKQQPMANIDKKSRCFCNKNDVTSNPKKEKENKGKKQNISFICKMTKK